MSDSKTVYEFFPKFGKIRDEVLFGLSKRDRSLITVAVLTALYRTDELKVHLKRAIDNGVTQEEIGGLITHLAFYAGWPTAVNCARLAKAMFEEQD
jgi:4-carboxymuconolactone decarboxylase